MPDFAIIDSHVHLADPKRFGYAWTKNAPSLNRQVLPDDLMKAASPVKIDRFVFVEVDVDLPQHLDEAQWISNGPEQTVGVSYVDTSADLDTLTRFLQSEGWSFTVNQ